MEDGADGLVYLRCPKVFNQPRHVGRAAASGHRRLVRAASWPLHAARVLCTADPRGSPELVDRRLLELDVQDRLVEVALAARIVATARAYLWSPSEALHLDLDEVLWHQQDPLETLVPEAVAAEVNGLHECARADQAWWVSVCQHFNAILHGQLLAGTNGDARPHRTTRRPCRDVSLQLNGQGRATLRRVGLQRCRVTTGAVDTCAYRYAHTGSAASCPFVTLAYGRVEV